MVLWRGFTPVVWLCCRKKHATFFTQDWKHAPNYVAKRYMEDVDRQVYFEDVKLQMDAKLWGEEYNRHNPPKKVCITRACTNGTLAPADLAHRASVSSKCENGLA